MLTLLPTVEFSRTQHLVAGAHVMPDRDVAIEDGLGTYDRLVSYATSVVVRRFQVEVHLPQFQEEVGGRKTQNDIIQNHGLVPDGIAAVGADRVMDLDVVADGRQHSAISRKNERSGKSAMTECRG